MAAADTPSASTLRRRDLCSRGIRLARKMRSDVADLLDIYVSSSPPMPQGCCRALGQNPADTSALGSRRCSGDLLPFAFRPVPQTIMGAAEGPRFLFIFSPHRWSGRAWTPR